VNTLRYGSLAMLLAVVVGATCRGPTETESAISDITPPTPARVDVSGRLIYADGEPAAGIPFEVEVEAGGVSRVGTTDPRGAFTAKQILGAADTSVTLRLLDGFGVGLAGDADGLGGPTVAVPVKSAGRLEDAYLLAAPKAMVLVTVPEHPSPPISRVVGKLDLIGVHREREILTMLGPERIVHLRALGLEVLVLDVDANAYAAKTGEMTDDERLVYIDGRIQAARTELARLTASGAAPR
jgi:hypothetical protein